MISKIKCVRMPGGEELIGEIVTETDTTVTIKTPASVLIVPGQMGNPQFSIGLMPWMPYSEDTEFVLSRDKIITIHNPNIDLINNYNRMFGSGIQIAAAGSLPQ